MKKIILFFPFSVFLFGCAVGTGILVEPSDNTETLRGEAVATLISGTFQVSNPDGLVCDGKYNQWSSSRVLKSEVRCNDGRYGDATILRTGPNLKNGSGEGSLNDGTTFKILLGEIVHYPAAQDVRE